MQSIMPSARLSPPRAQRPWLLRCALLSIAGALAACHPSADTPQKPDDARFADVEIVATEVRPNIFMLVGKGGNMGLFVGPEGALLIDDSYAPLSQKILATIGRLHKGAIKYVLNTHWHGDHTGSNEVMGELAPIISHHNVRARLSTEQTLFGKVYPALPTVALPVVTYEKQLAIYLNDETIVVDHLARSHTDGDSIVRFEKANVVHLGDLFWSGTYPFVDLDHGGSVSGLIRSIGDILDTIDEKTVIIPGHGPLGNKADLEAYRAMLTDSSQAVCEALKTKMSADEMQQKNILGPWEKPWGQGYITQEKWLNTLVTSLTGQCESNQ